MALEPLKLLSLLALAVGLPLAWAQAPPVPDWLTTAPPNTTTSPEIVAIDPLCGRTQRNLDEDPLRRHCLRQCILSPSGSIQPFFSEWEDYCRETSQMDDWDPQCQAFLCCMFGCDVWGGDSTFCLTAQPIKRREMLVETKAQMYSAGLTKEKRCALEKCNAYCARRVFLTCRETQYVQHCESTNPRLYGCDVNCNAAWHGFHPSWFAIAVGTVGGVLVGSGLSPTSF
eukprot:TRINITY_DN34832_c0_g1_i1.p1 TRINITY_DN34832_c0_g1~~TRINITY_DN34832_c0_g1_i1.p1  ORF type:complete len:249 (+),score=33.90 TRINITY_DN34832_c0_g1_i1:65-748(+)